MYYKSAQYNKMANPAAPLRARLHSFVW